MISTIRKNYLWILLAYVALSGLLIVFGLLLHSAGRTQSFWMTLNTIELILFIPFAVVSMIAGTARAGKYSYRMGGAPPKLIQYSFYYVGATAFCLAANTFIYDHGHIFLYIQLVLTAAMLLVAVWIRFMHGGTTGENLEQDLGKLDDTPRNLAKLLQAKEERLSNVPNTKPLLDVMSGLREDLLYRLPGAGKILKNPRFIAIADEVRTLMIEFPDKPTTQQIQKATETFEHLREEAKKLKGAG